MIKVITLLLFALLTGCQSVESESKNSRQLVLTLFYTIKVRPLLTEKLLYVSKVQELMFGLSPRMEPEVLLSFQA